MAAGWSALACTIRMDIMILIIIAVPGKSLVLFWLQYYFLLFQFDCMYWAIVCYVIEMAIMFCYFIRTISLSLHDDFKLALNLCPYMVVIWHWFLYRRFFSCVRTLKLERIHMHEVIKKMKKNATKYCNCNH